MTMCQEDAVPRSVRARFESMWSTLTDVGRDPVRGGYSRHIFDDAELHLREWFTAEAAARGLQVETDRNGNLWAWWRGLDAAVDLTAGSAAAPRALVTGSHLDSVPGGGAFDGPLGVVSALLAVDELRSRGVEPQRPVAVVVFAEEEGGRFGLPCLGSRLLAGAVDPERVRALQDRDGLPFDDAARRAGVDPELLGPDPGRLGMIGTFLELHIEQGRLLHRADPEAPIGVGSGIVAHGRWRVTVTGCGNHAGTTVIADRRDPMIVAAHAVHTARAAANAHHGAVATVGRIVPTPGGTNVIASSVDLWLDVRYGSARDTDALVTSIIAQLRQHAVNEGCTLEVRQESASPSVSFDAELQDRLAGLLQAPVVPTGAGHDAGILAEHVPSGMLYVRNPSGISHAPGEHADTDDCVAGVMALTDCLAALLDQEPARP